MKKLLALLTIYITLTSFNSLKINEKLNDDVYFKIEVVQDEKVIKPKNNFILLKKKPFKFKLTLIKTKNVSLSSSWGTYYYDYPDDKNIFECQDRSFFEGCRFVAVKTGNEDKFNTNKDIFVGDGDYQFNWFYLENKDWYRMDKGATVKEGVVYAEVTVENIYDLDKRDLGTFEKSEYSYPIEKINQDIYMVFATDLYESGMEYPKELQREKFILRFK